jgi:hypothetical protein
VSCATLAEAAAVPLPGTATRAERYLLVEWRGAWGRDVLSDSGLPPAVRARLEAWTQGQPHSRVLLVRRPERRRRRGTVVYVVRCLETAAAMARLELDRLEDILDADLEPGPCGPLDEPLYLVCAHGRRDPCCARLGVPLYDALAAAAGSGRVWQSSHQGGHRFAGNVLVLPHAVQLGRVRAEDAVSVATLLDGGAVPLHHYRGRTIHSQAAQAADARVREALGLASLRDVRYRGAASDGAHVFETPGSPVRVQVDASTGPSLPPSCGAAPEPTTVLTARVESLP